MGEENERDGIPEFRVVDKRRFDSDGNPKDPGEPVTTDEEKPSTAGMRDPGDGRSLSIDFSSFVKSLLATGLVQSGGIEPAQGQDYKDPKGADQTLDVLLMLAEKTKGNLDPKEEEDLKRAVSDLALSIAMGCTRPEVLAAFRSKSKKEAMDAIEYLASLLNKVSRWCTAEALKDLRALEADLKITFVREFS